ncbi:MAG: VOC family protein [Maritimibacter sp.]
MAARLDHLVVTADRLGAGAEYLHDTLGLMPGPGGDHAAMGTHNRLLSLGPQTYLEAIAVDPDGPEPGHKRWFGLDQPPAQPRLSHWALRVDDLDVRWPMRPKGSACRWNCSVEIIAGASPCPRMASSPLAGCFQR